MTAKVLNFRGHHWARCRRGTCMGCMLCNGGLHQCDRCGGAEASLPTHCPGERMSCENMSGVQMQKLDYDERLGGWTYVTKHDWRMK